MEQMDGIHMGHKNGCPVFHEYLLTKTLVNSPIIRQIFDVNLRDPDTPDIIFIKVPYIFLTFHSNI
jgi:hypothetical protein